LYYNNTYFVSLSLILKEEEGLSVLENGVLRKICGTRRMKMTTRYKNSINKSSVILLIK
jgi:hypothetical protein